MSSAEIALQVAIVAGLRADAALLAAGCAVYDGPPPRAPFPYIAISDGLAIDWSTKTAMGREIRVPLTVWDDGEEPARLHELMADVARVVSDLPRDLPGWRLASVVFLRGLIARDAAGPWAGLVEHRVRMIEV